MYILDDVLKKRSLVQVQQSSLMLVSSSDISDQREDYFLSTLNNNNTSKYTCLNMKILLLSLSLATYSFSFPVISSVGKVPVSFFDKTSWHYHHPDTMNTEVTDETLPTRRDVIQKQLSSVLITSLMSSSSSTTLNVNAATSNNVQKGLILDVNNSMAREFTAFPGKEKMQIICVPLEVSHVLQILV